jgi:hypothetical protein
LEKQKIGDEPLMALTFFLLCLQIVFKFDKTAVLQGNKQKMSEIQYVETRWALG